MTQQAQDRVRGSWFGWFAVVWLVIWAAQLTPIQLLLPLQLNTANTAEGWIGGVLWSGIVLGFGGLAGIIAAPITGSWSDRSTARWGRRKPWALLGVWMAGVGLAALAFADSPWLVAIDWAIVSIGLYVAMTALSAMIADQLTEQRGAASAVVGAANALGVVLGVAAVVLLGLDTRTAYLVLAAVVIVFGTLATVLLPDPLPLERVARTPGLARQLRSIRDHDFAWMLVGRLVVNIGNALVTALLLFYLLFGLGQSNDDAETNLLLVILVYTVFVVIASAVAGPLSDRAHRRKGFVLGSAVLQGLAAWLILIWPDLTGVLVAAALIGVGFGVFNSVGLAFAADVLPNPDDHALDMGLANVAFNLGQLLGPLIGAALVAAVGGFWLLFVVSGLCSVLGGLSTLFVRHKGTVNA